LQCPGRWPYGGIWFDHYGHFLLETLARAWHLADLPGPVVFHRPPDRPGGPIAATMTAWQTELVTSLLGTPSRIHFVTSTMEFEELAVAEAGCVLGERCTTDQAAAAPSLSTSPGSPRPTTRPSSRVPRRRDTRAGSTIVSSGSSPPPPAGGSAIAAGLDVRQDFTAVWRILHDSGV
jgi:hypothetical protein